MEAQLLIDSLVIVGVGIVTPLALGKWGRWIGAAVAAVVALTQPVGPLAAAVAGVWVVIALLELGVAARQALAVDDRTVDALVPLAAHAFAVVASLAFLTSRAGIELLDIREPITELTAIHFTYAGVGALMLATGARRSAGRSQLLRSLAVGATLVAPPIVALGFVAQHPIPQVGGAVVMSIGVLSTAALQLGEARNGAPEARTERGLLAVSGLTPWVAMVLAVSWAASNYWDVPALTIPDMARTHGVLNTVFVVVGLFARRTGPR